ncbi:MAG: ATP-binding protein, partial [Dehalococcoidia bacterium]
AVLRLRAESEFLVPPLALPAIANNRQASVGEQGGRAGDRRANLGNWSAELRECAAVSLFVQRAQAVKADFSLTDENAEAVAAICATLDGLPLAIELAAVRVKLLPPQAMLARMNQRLKLLTGGARDLPERQQTLRQAIAWSYDLLDSGEQTLFRQLSVFVGGCDLEAAEAVSGATSDLEIELLDGLGSLVNKSLVRQQEVSGGEPRFWMLETLREYGLDALAAQGEMEEIQRRHAIHFLALAEEAEPKLTGREQHGWLDRLEREHDNLRATHDWFRAEEEGEPGLRLCGALWRFWQVGGYLSEGRERLEQILALPAANRCTSGRAKALNAAGNLARTQSDYGSAEALYEESLAICRKLGERRGIAWSLNNLGIIARRRAEYGRARVLYQESLAVYQQIGDTRAIAGVLNNLGSVALPLGELTLARSLFQQSLAAFRERGDGLSAAMALNSLADVARKQKDDSAARALSEESLAMLREVGDRRGTALVLNNLAEMSCKHKDYSRARTLYEESLLIAHELGDRRLTALVLQNLGELADRQSNYLEAVHLYRESLAVRQAVADRAGVARCLSAMGVLSQRHGDMGRAACLFGAAATLQRTLDAPVANGDDEGYADSLASVRAALGASAFANAWAKGERLPLEQLLIVEDLES